MQGGRAKASHSEQRAVDQNNQYRAIRKFPNLKLLNTNFGHAIVEKMNAKLRECQVELGRLKKEKAERLGLAYEEPADVILKEFDVAAVMTQHKVDDKQSKELQSHLSLHIIGPLVESYELAIATLQRELRRSQLALKSHLEDSKQVVLENDQLREQLETTKREMQ